MFLLQLGINEGEFVRNQCQYFEPKLEVLLTFVFIIKMIIQHLLWGNADRIIIPTKILY